MKSIMDNKRKIIPAAKVGGVVHATYRIGCKGISTYCGFEPVKDELLLLLQEPENITCEECRKYI